MTQIGVVTVAVVAIIGQSPIASQAPDAPRVAVDALLAADRDFATAATSLDAVTALTRMFAPEVVIPGAPARLYRGLEAVTSFLRSSPDASARASWSPVRGGVSADGLHGFTFGFMMLTRQDGSTVPLKYMAYWVKGPSGWRVVGYKRARRPLGDVDALMMPHALPTQMTQPRTDATWLTSLRDSLSEAERAFSNDAQLVGLGPAFAKWGAATAVNMGGPATPGFLVGPTAIADSLRAGAPGPGSPVSWSTDAALVASSGDLGISFGYIRSTALASAGTSERTPFFTIWSRPGGTGDWRYIAE